MRKILLAGTALAGLVALAAPAQAELKMDLGGYFRGYGVWADNDEPGTAAPGDDFREFDLRRNAELHATGETTLDNGLTVGAHAELELGNNDLAAAGGTGTDEVYAYGSGGWGRVNLGAEDGAAYLLQVAAPSADSNVDGLRTYVQALNPLDPVFVAPSVPGLPTTLVLDYDHVSDPTGSEATDRISYMTPKFNAFQAGVSYAPETGMNARANNVAPMATDDNFGDYDQVWEAGVRWDGEFEGFGLSVGGGFSHADLEAADTLVIAAITSANAAPLVNDDLTQWNGGVNVAWQGFSLGGSFMRAETENLDARDVAAGGLLGTGASDTLATIDVTKDTWTVGLGWDNGPYHLGGTWLKTEIERDAVGVAADDGELAAIDADVERFTVGGGYTYGPGMTFRGAVAWGEFDNSTGAADAGQAGGFAGAAATNNDFTQVTVGTDIQF